MLAYNLFIHVCFFLFLVPRQEIFLQRDLKTDKSLLTNCFTRETHFLTDLYMRNEIPFCCYNSNGLLLTEYTITKCIVELNLSKRLKLMY